MFSLNLRAGSFVQLIGLYVNKNAPDMVGTQGDVESALCGKQNLARF